MVECDNTKIWLDFGLSFSKFYDYYAEFLNPRKHNALGDFFEFDLLPKLMGLYREDFLKKLKLKAYLDYDGVFLSHAHSDHAACIAHLHKDIPIYCGFTTKLILEAMQTTGSGSFTDFVIYKENFVTRNSKAIPRYKRNIKCFRTGDEIQVNDLVAKPIHVDHSLPGSYGFIIYTPRGSVVYTGDFRLHGRKHLTQDFLDEVTKEKHLALICEGTRLGEKGKWEQESSENAVQEKVSKIISNTSGLVIVNFPSRDIDRLNTFYNAAKQNGRKLVIDLKQAYLLKLLEKDENLDAPSIKDKDIIIFAEKARFGLITEDIPFEEQLKDYFVWQRPFLEQKNCLHYQELKEMQEDIVFYCNFFDLPNLIDIRPVKGSCYIYSLCEPFNEEMILDFNKIRRWIDHFNLSLHIAHASGHCSKEDLVEVVKGVDTKMIFPIHTEMPLKFKEFVNNVTIPEKDKKIRL